MSAAVYHAAFVGEARAHWSCSMSLPALRRCSSTSTSSTSRRAFTRIRVARVGHYRLILRSPCYQQHAQRRALSVETWPAVLIPPLVFGGLLVSLWAYKCLMMVVFQNKIIYMPSVPPFSRAEKVSDYARQCRPVEWREHEIRSMDGTKLKLLEGSVSSPKTASTTTKNVVVLYFQGNAASSPPRLPYLSRILAAVQHRPGADDTRYQIVALSYRGFWTSSGRPSQPGIELDVQATIDWALHTFDADAQIVLWGQSIGAGAASVGLANLLRSSHGAAKLRRIAGLVLETPFVDLRAMLVALYPQKFLPYRYLAPFLRSTWDSRTALSQVGEVKPQLRVLVLQAGSDELVPSDNASILEQVCTHRGIKVKRVVVSGALHTEVMVKSQGRRLIADFLRSF